MYNPTAETSIIAGEAVKRYFRKKFPYISTRQYSFVEEQELKHRYRKWKVIIPILLLPYFIGLMILCGFLLLPIYKYYHSLFIVKQDVFFPPTIFGFIMVNGIPFALATIMFVIEGTQKLFMGNDYHEYEDFYNDDQGYDNHKAGLMISKIGLIILLITLPVTFTARIIAKEKTVVIKTLLSIQGREYKYNNIRQIVYYLNSENNNGNVTKNLHYRIFFGNEDISLNRYFSGAEDAEPFVRLLSGKSRVSVDTAEVDRR